MNIVPKFNHEQIRELYVKEAVKHGMLGTSTIQDLRTRKLELQAIGNYVAKLLLVKEFLPTVTPNILEVGCGNGYVALELAKQFDINIIGFDSCREMIDCARKQDISKVKGRTGFFVEDVLTYKCDHPFDMVFSIRCLQNLVYREDQMDALGKIAAALKPGADYIMCEGFNDGLQNLNEARAELDLPPIEESWHNNFFREAETIWHMQNLGCELVERNHFLSGYYFGSRVLLPALAKNKNVHSSSRLNDYFCALPPAGDFCPMKILVFRKQA